MRFCVITGEVLVPEHEFVGRCRARMSEFLADLETLVRTESPTSDLKAVARSADAVARLGTERLGVEPERIVREGYTHLRWRFGSEKQSRVLVLAHHDTVWPMGSVDRLPWSVEDGTIRGPGCFDMKVGLVQAIHALRLLKDGEGSALDGVTLLVTGDEEFGSPSSQELIESEARGCAAALVLEASGPGGALKSRRKGVSLYTVEVTGRAAHAGLEPERGVNATVELAHQIVALSRLGDPELGTSVTPTLLSGGTTSNTVPESARVAVDVRCWTVAEQSRVDRSIRALAPVLRGSAIAVLGGPNRPPLEHARSAALFARARSLAEENHLGALSEIEVGGASDGNLTAGVGTPTLDGLGAVGGGAHAEDEHALTQFIPQRTALVALLVADRLAY